MDTDWTQEALQGAAGGGWAGLGCPWGQQDSRGAAGLEGGMVVLRERPPFRFPSVHPGQSKGQPRGP
jgi:hypothetical protein